MSRNTWIDSRHHAPLATNGVLLKMGGFKPVLEFIINLFEGGPSPTLIKELHSLDSRDREFVLKHIVRQI
jgi:hypothetical protein